MDTFTIQLTILFIMYNGGEISFDIEDSAHVYVRPDLSPSTSILYKPASVTSFGQVDDMLI